MQLNIQFPRTVVKKHPLRLSIQDGNGVCFKHAEVRIGNGNFIPLPLQIQHCIESEIHRPLFHDNLGAFRIKRKPHGFRQN